MDYSWPPTNLSHDQCWSIFFFSLALKHYNIGTMFHFHHQYLIFCAFNWREHQKGGEMGVREGESLPDNRASALIGEQ